MSEELRHTTRGAQLEIMTLSESNDSRSHLQAHPEDSPGRQEDSRDEGGELAWVSLEMMRVPGNWPGTLRGAQQEECSPARS